MEIWVYRDSTLNDFIQPVISQFLFFFGKAHQVQWLAVTLPGETGKKTETARVANTPDKPGYVIYGPFLGVNLGLFRSTQLSPGKYRATVYYAAENELDAESVGHWEQRIEAFHQG